jgi:hypothetical protein
MCILDKIDRSICQSTYVYISSSKLMNGFCWNLVLECYMYMENYHANLVWIWYYHSGDTVEIHWITPRYIPEVALFREKAVTD